MAPRRRAGARSRADKRTADALQLASLPPELLTAIFCHVPLAERHRSLALVCRQWAELVHSPALLASLHVAMGPTDAARLLQRLRSLLAWAAGRAWGHVQQLRLEVAACRGEGAGAGHPLTAEQIEATFYIVALAALLATSLRELSLTTRGLELPPLGPLTAPLAGLTSLEVGCDAPHLTVDSSMCCLSGLQRLRLKAADGWVELEPEAVLPPSLTSLWMQSFVGAVPPQLGSLRHLRELTLLGGCRDATAYAPLARLHSSLTALNLTAPSDVPDCLGQLTALQSLTIDDIDGELGEPDDQMLEQALPRLQQLTAVYLFSGGLPDTPAALSSLRHLHTVCWSGWNEEPLPLPGGAWLAGLRRLALSCHFLSDAASVETLSTARQLERLGVSDTCQHEDYYRGDNKHLEVAFYRDAPVRAILAWAQRHGSLRLLALGQVSRRTAAAAAAAQRQRPGLGIEAGRGVGVFQAACGYVGEQMYESSDEDE